MNRCVLFDLPEVLSRLVLVQWVGLVGMPRLDSAFCNRGLRDLFLPLAYHRLTVFSNEVCRYKRYSQFEPILQWAVNRRVQLDGVVITGYTLHRKTLVFEFLAVCGSAIRWVKFDCYRSEAGVFSQQALLEVATRCPNVHKLKVNVLPDEPRAGCWGEHLLTLTTSYPKLLELSLSVTVLSEQDLASALKHCVCLQRLCIAAHGQMIPVDIAIPTLKEITCNFRFITDAVMIAIGDRCSNLETLIVFESAQLFAGFAVTDVGVRAVLQGCPLLRETDVECAKGISIELRVELAKRRNMTTLDLGDWHGMDNELAQGVLSVSPNLTELSCWGCDWLADATLAVCAQHCPLVTSFTLAGCLAVTDNGVRVLVEGLSSMVRCVCIHECPLVSDDALFAVAERCPLLEYLRCPVGVSDAAVVKLAKSCPELVRLNMQDTEVSDAGLTALARHCSKLQSLDLCCCPYVTAQAVHSVVSSCPHLSEIGLPPRLKDYQLPQLADPTRRFRIICF
jgi:hypothetical protein